MHSIVSSVILIAFFICNALIIPSKALPNKDNNETDSCSEEKDCLSCIGTRGCALWYCILPNEEIKNEMLCKNTSSSKPKEVCADKWQKLESHQKCDSINTTIHKSEIQVTNKMKPSISYAKTLINDECPTYNTCDTCFGNAQCAFWYCLVDKEWTGAMACEHPGDKGPTTPCEGKWRKLQRPDTCASIHKKNTTTTTPPPITTTSTTPKTPPTTTTSTTTTTAKTTTTQSPETTTNKNTTTTTTTTSSPITKGPEPHHEGEAKLTGWTIAGITISSVVVVLVLVGVSYKKVMKIYRARNPYRTLNE